MFSISHVLTAATAAAVLMTASQAYAQSKLSAEAAMAALRAVQSYAKNDGSDPSTVVVDAKSE